jgi:hypothetical protein
MWAIEGLILDISLLVSARRWEPNSDHKSHGFSMPLLGIYQGPVLEYNSSFLD